MSKLIIANWKMLQNPAELSELCSKLPVACDNFIIAAPMPYLALLKYDYPHYNWAAQDVSSITNQYGAYTGEISANLLADLKINYALIGHSERRQYNQETPEAINAKLAFCLEANVTPILCIGDSLADYRNNSSLNTLKEQLASLYLPSLARIIIAYEPIWAIGSGLTPKPEELEILLNSLRKILPTIRNLAKDSQLVYGGSVNSTNIAALTKIAMLDGFLVGKASTDSGQLQNILNEV